MVSFRNIAGAVLGGVLFLPISRCNNQQPQLPAPTRNEKLQGPHMGVPLDLDPKEVLSNRKVTEQEIQKHETWLLAFMTDKAKDEEAILEILSTLKEENCYKDLLKQLKTTREKFLAKKCHPFPATEKGTVLLELFNVSNQAKAEIEVFFRLNPNLKMLDIERRNPQFLSKINFYSDRFRVQRGLARFMIAERGAYNKINPSREYVSPFGLTVEIIDSQFKDPGLHPNITNKILDGINFHRNRNARARDLF